MRIAILGGSFNPIHLGHLYLADAVLTEFSYDRLILVPSNKNPFKETPQGAASEARLDMLCTAISTDPRIGIDDCELRRGGTSYMIDTLADLEGRYKNTGKIGLVLGDDLASGFPKWRDAEALASRVDLILGRRQGRVDDFPYPHRSVRNKILEISSSELRDMIAKDEAWQYLVPAGVRNLIKKQGLYGFPHASFEAVLPSSLIQRVEAYVRDTLDTQRFLHSRNVALDMVYLSKWYRLDLPLAYLAGLAHDLCKMMDPKIIIEIAQRDGLPIHQLELKNPVLLHGRAAAVLLREKFELHNQSLLQAIGMHTTGGPHMDILAKLLYIADKIDPLKGKTASLWRERIETLELDELFVLLFSQSVRKRLGRGLPLAPATEALWATLPSGARK